MAQQYNPKRVFRLASNPLLKQYFENRGQSLTVAWDELGPQTVEPIFAAFQKIPEGPRRRIEIDLHEVHDVAASDQINVIVEEAQHQGDDLVPLLTPMESRYDKALWTCLNRSRIWEAAVRFAHADGMTRYWVKRCDVPQVEPDTSDPAMAELRKSVSAFYINMDGRGRRCAVEHFPRGQQDYFFIYISDHPSTYESWDENDNLVPNIERRAFEVVICYDRNDGTLDTYAKGGKKIREPLQDVFCRAILHERLQPEDGSKRLYNLDGLLRRDFPFDFDPVDGVRHVEIQAMQVAVVGNPHHKHRIDVNPDEGPNAIWDALEREINAEHLPLSVLRPTYAKIHFDLDNNGHGRSMTFEVREKSCTLKSKKDSQRELGEKYLKKWGIDVSAQS